MVPNIETLNILLVEDDTADQKLIRSMIEKQEKAYDLCVASSAEEAVEILRPSENSNGGFTRPDLIVLDLNMPGMGGREFLKHIKADERLKQIPVVILTCSISEMDILDSYRLQAAGFVTKPAGLIELERVITGIIKYWSVLCRLPCRGY
ncbi:response regulator [Chloroflexota bacterium]